MHAGNRLTEADEDELYQDPGSASSGSDAIDSDVEDRILSHMYYRTADDAAATSVPAPALSAPASDTGEVDEDDSRYSIKPAARGVAGALHEAAGTPDAGQDGGSSSASSDGEEATAHDDPAAAESDGEGAKIDATRPADDSTVANSGVEDAAATGAPMEHRVVRIDALLESATLSEPVSTTHEAAVPRARDPEDDEYGYLDEAEIQGRNRYFMEEKETICRKCKKAGHIAKDCTTVTCMVCGKDGHISKDCKLTGSVCHGCNMRGHMVSECPLRSGRSGDKRAPRAFVCNRCDSRNHHTEECATIWRRYAYAGPRPEKYNDVVAWCYNCAGDGHFGDDCRQPRARGAAAFFSDTAFSAHNCPGKCLRGTTPAGPHHTPSSRSSPYHRHMSDRRTSDRHTPDRHTPDRHTPSGKRDWRRDGGRGRRGNSETPTRYTPSTKHKRSGPKRPKQPASTPRKPAKGGDR
ncbi:hypothetical protein H4R19_005721 [Coemansia spiralis]|nr:hypothetical protein H4R19_005721 [Coemansia spiralis]